MRIYFCVSNMYFLSFIKKLYIYIYDYIYSLKLSFFIKYILHDEHIFPHSPNSLSLILFVPSSMSILCHINIHDFMNLYRI